MAKKEDILKLVKLKKTENYSKFINTGKERKEVIIESDISEIQKLTQPSKLTSAGKERKKIDVESNISDIPKIEHLTKITDSGTLRKKLDVESNISAPEKLHKLTDAGEPKDKLKIKSEITAPKELKEIEGPDKIVHIIKKEEIIPEIKGAEIMESETLLGRRFAIQKFVDIGTELV